MKIKLTEADRIEMKELFDGTYKSVRELAKIFKVPEYTMRYLLNYKGFKDKQCINAMKWRKKNPEKYRESTRKASSKWAKNNPEKALARHYRWVAKNPEKAKASKAKAAKKWKAKNPEKCKLYNRTAYLKHRAKLLNK